MSVAWSEISPLEDQIIGVAMEKDMVAEVCDFVEYYTDLGKVEGHWRVKYPVMTIVNEIFRVRVRIRV